MSAGTDIGSDGQIAMRRSGPRRRRCTAGCGAVVAELNGSLANFGYAGAATFHRELDGDGVALPLAPHRPGATNSRTARLSGAAEAVG
jgi:hypothetical protein